MTVVITGASRGIGAGLEARYRDRKERVIGTSRQGEMALDVTDQASQADFAKKLNGCPVDLLICNAGVYLDKGDTLQDGYEHEKWADSFATNVTGVFLTVQSLMPNLVAAKSPKIAIISSQMGSSERAPGGSYIYRASKAAVLNLGRNLAADLGAQGIAVGIYHPGWVVTDMGGSSASISVADSVSGLMQRFDALTLDKTGVFETWEGKLHPY